VVVVVVPATAAAAAEEEKDCHSTCFPAPPECAGCWLERGQLTLNESCYSPLPHSLEIVQYHRFTAGQDLPAAA